MSKQILKNTPSQSRERPLSLQLPPAAIGYHVAKRNPAATITLRHTTKCSTSDYTFCRRIIGKTTHHNLPHYNIVSKGYTHSLPPCDLVRKDTHGNSPPYNIAGRDHATILLLNIIGGEPIFRDNEQWLSRARATPSCFSGWNHSANAAPDISIRLNMLATPLFKHSIVWIYWQTLRPTIPSD